MRTLPLAALVVLGLLPCACRLIDQRDFERAGLAPGSDSLARSRELAAAQAGQPLVTVRPADSQADWQTPLLSAVHGALDKMPGAQFDIVTFVPIGGADSAQEAAAQAASADAQAVATALQADGIPAERLHLLARGDTGSPARDVSVYLR